MLLIGAIVVAIISRRLPRSRIWIAAGIVSFVVTTAWARYSMPYPPAFTLAVDAGVCLLIYFFGEEEWEDKVYTIFQLSVLISLVYLAGPIDIEIWQASAAAVFLTHVGYVAIWRKQSFVAANLAAFFVVYASLSWVVFGAMKPVTINMSHWLYVVLLELCNWAALAVIGKTALFDGAGENEDDARSRWAGNLHSPDTSWRKARATPPFHKVTK